MYSVKTGFWINWELGAVEGATLTLDTYYGLILVSFLTLFVQFCGGCFWRTLCFVLHQYRSTLAAQDGLFHQQQIILRNAVTAPNALFSLTQSAFAWQSKTSSPVRRSLPLLVITLIHIGCFAVAGLFSSQIASTKAGQALVQSSICGYPQKMPTIQSLYSTTNLTTASLPVFNTQVLLGRFTVTKATSYVRSCYNNDPDTSVDCNRFVRRNLMSGGSVDLRAQCPFGSNACMTPAVRFDSGLLNSNDDLGLNLPERDGILFRRVTTCAPIKVEQYATAWMPNLIEAYGGKTNTSVKFYQFGASDTGCTATRANQTTNSTTFCISQWMKDYLPGAYTIVGNTAYVDQPAASEFRPIPDFNASDADVTLLGIFSKTIYTAKVDDPLFSAQNQSNRNSQFYTPTNEFATLGCLEQYQFCNARNAKCTKLDGLYGTQEAMNRGDLDFSGRQKATSRIIWEAAWAMALQWTVKLMNSRVLLAQDWVYTANTVGSGPLQANQWQVESYNLHNLSLAVFQHRLNQYSAPETFQLSSTLNAADYREIPTDPDMKDMCRRQRVISSTHYGVSVLGMAIILGVGSILILVDQWLEKVWFNCFHAKSRIAKQAEWTQTSTFQLHRQAVEARGIGPWEKKNLNFPVLQGGATFSGLGIREEEIGEMREETDSKLPYHLVAGEVPSEDNEKRLPEVGIASDLASSPERV